MFSTTTEYDRLAATAEPTSRVPRILLDTNIDLEGRPAVERLALDEQRLLVFGESSLHQPRREWWIANIEGFRIEPSVGSYFLQAQVEGQWVEVLRCPGSPDASATGVLDELNARCRDARPDPSGETAADGQTATDGHLSPRRPDAGRSRRWSIGRRLLGMLRPFHGSVLLLLVLSVGAVAIEIAPPMLQGALIDRVLRVSIPESGPQQLLVLLAAIVGALLLVRLTSMLVAVWKGIVSSRVGTTMTANLRNELVRKLNDLPLAFHDRSQVGMLMSRVAYDTETLHTLVYHMTSGLLLQSLQLVGIGAALFYLNPKLALITMLPMPLIIAGGWYFTRYLNPRNQHYWDAVGRQASALTGMLSGIRVVKAFVQEDRETRRFCDSSGRLRDSRQTVDFSTSTFTALMGFLFALGNLAVWYIGGRDVLFGEMQLGALVAFLAYLAMFYTPLTTIGESTTWFSNFFTTSRRIFEVLDTPSESAHPVQADSTLKVEGRLEFDGVSFGYDKTRPVLKDISFAVQPGEMIGIVGRSGSGKSTLVSLIGRLYEADAGHILIDGVDLRQMPLKQLRRQIGMVLQDPFLFRGPVVNNITYGHQGATPEQVLLAARRADAHDFIMRMPLAYDSQLGEGGIGLSGGERQRLSIARALLVDPAILILDEATGSVDAESERAICESIHRFARRRTTIVIAHRLSTLQGADRLLVFDQGRLMEQGTPQQLLARGGLYATLARLQWNLAEDCRRIETITGNGQPSRRNGSTIELGGQPDLVDSFSLDDRNGLPANDRAAARGGARCSRELNWLEASEDMIEDAGQGMLVLTAGGERHAGVYAVRAFPAAYQREFLSLRKRDPSGREVEAGLIRALDAWPREAQQAVDGSLARRYFMRTVREVRQVRTSGNTLVLSVIADSGPARLQLEKPSEGFQRFGDDGVLWMDAGGNYYVLPDRRGLPKHQQRLLSLYFGD